MVLVQTEAAKESANLAHVLSASDLAMAGAGCRPIPPSQPMRPIAQCWRLPVLASISTVHAKADVQVIAEAREADTQRVIAQLLEQWQVRRLELPLQQDRLPETRQPRR